MRMTEAKPPALTFAEALARFRAIPHDMAFEAV